MKKRTYSADGRKSAGAGAAGLREDASLLRRPLRSSLQGFHEARKAYESASVEVRQVLLHECSLIYECRACRNLFRSVENFLNHKRLYCGAIVDGNSETFPDPVSTLLDPPTKAGDLKDTPSSSDLSPDEGLAFKEDDERVQRACKSIAEGWEAMRFEKSERIRREIEASDFWINKTAIAKAKESLESAEDRGRSDKNSKTCQLCDLQFETTELQRLHVQRKHPTTYIFECPSCPLQFSEPSSVIEHLATVHKKHIRGMKHHSKSKGMCSKKPLRALKRPSPNEADTDTAPTEGEDDKKVPLSCHNCTETFQGHEALATHLSGCRDSHNTEAMAIKPSELHSIHTSTPSESVVKEKIDLLKNIKQEFNASDSQQAMEKCNTEESPLESGSTDFEAKPSEVSIVEEADIKYKIKESESAEPEEDDDEAMEDIKANTPKNKQSMVRCRCKICDKQFTALWNLRRHISIVHYGASKFGCTLCDYRAFRRYDIVNHLGFVHKMSGDREKMSMDYVTMHEVCYSRNDMEVNIEVITDEKELEKFDEVTKSSSNKKRRYRRKYPPSPPLAVSAAAPSVAAVAEERPMREKLRRTCSVEVKTAPVSTRSLRTRANLSMKTSDSSASKLSQAAEADTNTGGTGASDACGDDDYSSSRPKPIKGAAQRIAQYMIEQGRASPSTLPELPKERPQMRPRLASVQRTDLHHVPVIESTDLQLSELKSTFFEDSFLEKIAKRSAVGFRMKPSCLALEHSAVNSLLQKVDQTLHPPGSRTTAAAAGKLQIKVEAPEATENNETVTFGSQVDDHSATLSLSNGNHFIDPAPSIPRHSSPPPAPQKQFTVHPYFSEKKAKYGESLLRATLENANCN